MKTKRSVVFIMALSAVMVMGSANAFAHGRGGGHHGGRYNNNNTATSSYSCPYGNSACNQSGYCSVEHYNQYSNVQTTAPTQVVATQTEMPIATEAKDVVVTNVPIKAIIPSKTIVKDSVATTIPATTVEKMADPIPVVTNTTPKYTPYVCPYGNQACNQAGYCINNGNCNGYGNGNGNGYGCNGGGCRGYRY